MINVAVAFAVIRVMLTAANPCEGAPRYRRVEFLDMIADDPRYVADTGIDMDVVEARIAELGHTDVEILDTAIVCSHCRNGWFDMAHESC